MDALLKQLEAIASELDGDAYTECVAARIFGITKQMKAVEPVAWAHSSDQISMPVTLALCPMDTVPDGTTLYAAPPNTYTAEQVAPLVEASNLVLSKLDHEYEPVTMIETEKLREALAQWEKTK